MRAGAAHRAVPGAIVYVLYQQARDRARMSGEKRRQLTLYATVCAHTETLSTRAVGSLFAR
jgi:hypothetical protein